MRRIHLRNSASSFLVPPPKCVSSRCVWQLTRPGMSSASGKCSECTPPGAGTRACGPTAAILPPASTRTAPSSKEGAVTGCTRPARIRSKALGSDSDTEGRVDLAHLRRLGARIEPLPAPHFERAERRREEAVRPVHFARDEIVGAGPVAGRRAPLVHVAHELRPRGRDDAAAARVIHDPVLEIVADPDPG